MKLMAEMTRASMRLRSELIVQRLLRSDAMLDAAELLGSSLGTKKQIAFKDIVTALEHTAMGSEVAAPGIEEGDSVLLKRTVEGVVICEGESAGEVVVELGLLDPSSAVRLTSLDAFSKAALPSMPDERRWRETLTSRPLAPAELARFVADLLCVASTKLNDMSTTFAAASEFAIAHLVPSGRAYYESIVGPVAGNETTSEYLQATLYPHLKAIFKRDAAWGWLCAQATFSGLSMDLEAVFHDVDDGTLFASMLEADRGSPLAPLATLSAVLQKAPANAAALALAQEAMNVLISEANKETNERGCEVLFPALARLTFRCISADEEMWAAPSYWRWLTAFAHAHLLLQFFDFSNVELAQFQRWLAAAHPRVGEVVEYMDTFAEPSWLASADYLFMPWLVAAGYAIKLCDSAKVGADVYGEEQRQAFDVPPNKSVFAKMWSAVPDFMQGALRAVDRQDNVMDNELSPQLLDSPPAGEVARGSWITVLINARLTRLPDPLRSQIVIWIGEIAGENSVDAQHALELLCVAARIGAVQPDVGIADAVARALVGMADKCNSSQLAGVAWACIVLCAGAHPEKKARDDWLESRLIELAYSLPHGPPCSELAARIECMQQLQAPAERRYGRARYMALSAVA